MTDFTRLTCPPPPADWTDDGIYRAAFLALFNREDRAVLRQAGGILAAQAISADTADEPAIEADLRAALEDARMLATFLREISESTDGSTPDRARQLTGRGKVWSRAVAAIALAIRRALNGDEETRADPMARLALAAREILQEHREWRKLHTGAPIPSRMPWRTLWRPWRASQGRPEHLRRD